MKNTKHTENLDNSTPQEITSQSKRKILTSIGVSSGILGASALSQQWTKPIVNSIILPAHAQTTDAMGTDAPSTDAPGTDAPTTPPATTPEPAMGPMINVVGFPTSGMVGDTEGMVRYHITLSEAPAIDPDTGVAAPVTVSVMVDPVAAIGGSQPGDNLEPFTTMNYSDVQVVTMTAGAASDDPVTVTFSADGYADVTRMFTIVEDDNLGVTDVKAERVGNGPDVTVSWTAPDTTAEISRYRITDDVTDVVRTASAGATSHTVMGLKAGTGYIFSVIVDYKEGDPSTAEAADDAVTA